MRGNAAVFTAHGNGMRRGSRIFVYAMRNKEKERRISLPCEKKRDITLPQHNKHIWNREKKAPRRPSDKLNRQAVRLEAIFLMVCAA